MHSQFGAQAYRTASRHRSFREQESDVFVRVNAHLRGARDADPMILSKAVSDNDRLWIAVVDNVRDGENGLPQALRASIVSVGLAVRRECALESPDVAFLIGVNEQMIAGLSGL